MELGNHLLRPKWPKFLLRPHILLRHPPKSAGIPVFACFSLPLIEIATSRAVPTSLAYWAMPCWPAISLRTNGVRRMLDDVRNVDDNENFTALAHRMSNNDFAGSETVTITRIICPSCTFFYDGHRLSNKVKSSCQPLCSKCISEQYGYCSVINNLIIFEVRTRF